MSDLQMQRYSVIPDKNPREIVLLRGTGCKWRRCRFCDYHLDFSADETANFDLNSKVLSEVTGVFHKLEVINSGSFCDLDEKTMNRILQICREKEISQIHFECHWKDRDYIPALRSRFAAAKISTRIKIGIETFDFLFRESYLDKGIDETEPAVIAESFDECCLLQGLPGQTEDSMKRDIETGLANFERVCVNIMVRNSRSVLPDPRVIRIFFDKVRPIYEKNPRVDILMNNTDFGVGGDIHVE